MALRSHSLWRAGVRVDAVIVSQVPCREEVCRVSVPGQAQSGQAQAPAGPAVPWPAGVPSSAAEAAAMGLHGRG
jgi:hypothetical protein